MRRFWLIAVGAVFGAIGAANALEFGEFTTPNGTQYTVEEDFMNARYPRHVIGLAAQNRENTDGWLVFRCQENQTEVYFSSGQFDFFGFGTSPQVNVRFPSDEQASRASVSTSSDGEAVFFEQPIDFIVRAMEGGSVAMNGSYYSSAFRHNFILDDETKSAVRDMADTCGWSDRIPATAAAAVEEPTVNDELAIEIQALIDRFGLDEVRQAITDVTDTNAP